MKRTLVLMVLLAAALSAVAQEKPTQENPPQPGARQERPLSYYKLEFVLRELQDGKAINSRTYMMTVENQDRGEAKVGARVPVSTGNQFQYLDVGINLSCRVVGKEDYVSLRTSVEISSFALPEQQSAGASSQPVVRQMKSDMAAVVPLSKPTVIGIIDDANSTKRYEIAVTATKLK